MTGALSPDSRSELEYLEPELEVQAALNLLEPPVRYAVSIGRGDFETVFTESDPSQIERR